MNPHVYESKYELDSLAAVLKLAWNYWYYTKDTSCFAGGPASWLSMVRKILDTTKIMQRSTDQEGVDPTYKFERETTCATDTLGFNGRGPVANSGTGLSKCLFRPSDDAVSLPFLIPANAMMAVELKHLSELLALPGPTNSPSMSIEAAELGSQLDAAVQQFGIFTNPITGKKVYAYEIDGYGGHTFMDDANIPSLLSLPYLGYLDIDDPIYQNTRAMVLSYNNPYYWEGNAGKGIGGPHVGYGYIWPMSIIDRAMTSNSDTEITECLNMLKSTTAHTNYMHESFWKGNALIFTRAWFAWANTFFGELILTIGHERPYLIF